MNLKSRVKTLERNVKNTTLNNEMLKLRPTLDDYFTDEGLERVKQWQKQPSEIRELAYKSNGKKLEDFM